MHDPNRVHAGVVAGGYPLDILLPHRRRAQVGILLSTNRHCGQANMLQIGFVKAVAVGIPADIGVEPFEPLVDPVVWALTDTCLLFGMLHRDNQVLGTKARGSPFRNTLFIVGVGQDNRAASTLYHNHCATIGADLCAFGVFSITFWTLNHDVPPVMISQYPLIVSIVPSNPCYSGVGALIFDTLFCNFQAKWELDSGFGGLWATNDIDLSIIEGYHEQLQVFLIVVFVGGDVL